MKRFSILFLTLCILMQLAAALPAGAASDVALYADDKAGSSFELKPGDCIGVQFHAAAAFRSVTVNVKKVYRPAVNLSGVRLSLYQWNTSYAKSVAGKPVATKEYQEITGPASYSLSAGKTFAAGEYLFVYEDTAGTWSVPVYQDSLDTARFYKNGYEAGTDFAVTVETDQAKGFLKTLSADKQIGLSLNPEPSSWTATDGLGRTLDAYGKIPARQKDKYVGIFYWDTTGYWSKQTAPRNIQQLLDSVSSKVAEAARNDYNHELWAGGAVTWFWDEPIFGYYSSDDAYVIRKQAELLADADIDVIFFDFTHTEPDRHSFMKVFEVFRQARGEGVDTPDIAFMLPMGDADSCATRLRYLYQNLYSKGLYQDLWFYYEGKPLILAYNDHLQSTGTDRKIRDFFTYRRADAYSWRTEDFVSTPSRPFWGWLSTYPQTKYYNDTVGKKVEQITVGVAQNVDVKAHQPTAMNGTNVAGRSYTAGNYSYTYTKNGKSVKVTSGMADSVLYGLNFQQQWDYAIKADPTFIFVTGWNEWTVGRYQEFCGIRNGFPDQYNAEYSRDVEPSAGILKDHYYYQLVANVRRFKGVDAQKAAGLKKTIDLSGALSQWDAVPSYDHYAGSTRNRDENGFLGCQYQNRTMRNDIIRTKVAYDGSQVYFYVETAANLTPESGPAWMRLFLDTDFNGGTANWEGFEYVVNRLSPEDGLCVLERSEGVSADGTWKWSEAGRISYTVSGTVLQIAIPRKMLGLTNTEMAFRFKWSDNMQNDGDVMDFYLNGDVAPGGRFAFSFRASEAYEDLVIVPTPVKKSEAAPETVEPTEMADTETVKPETAQEDSAEPVHGKNKKNRKNAVYIILAAAAVLVIGEIALMVIKCRKK